jgi:hypothetical protein
MTKTREAAETCPAGSPIVSEGDQQMLLGQQNQQSLSVNTVWMKATHIGEILYLIGAALVLVHFFVEIGMLIGSIGKLYPAPRWIWEELNILVYVLAPIMWFRLLCVLSMYTLRFSQKENYAYIAISSAAAFVAALQPLTQPLAWYSYVAFPLLGATYAVQFTLDSHLPSRKSEEQATSSRPPAGIEPQNGSRHSSPQQSPTFAQIAHAYHQPSASFTQRVGIWHSPADARFAERLRIHLQPKIWQGQIDLWNPDHIQPGTKWQEERTRAIQSAAIAVVLVSADLMASDFIARYELPQILYRAMAQGTVILLLHVNPCNINGSGLEKFQPINSPDKPLAQLGPTDRDKILVRTASIICHQLRL